MSRHTGEMPGVVPLFRSHSNTGIQQKKAHFVDGGSRAGMSPQRSVARSYTRQEIFP
jgi:hypothetical protein